MRVSLAFLVLSILAGCSGVDPGASDSEDIKRCNARKGNCAPVDLATLHDLAMTPPPDLAMTPPADLALPPPADLSTPPPPPDLATAVPPQDLSPPPPPDLATGSGPDPCATATTPSCASADHCASDPVYYACWKINDLRHSISGLPPYQLNASLTQFSYNASLQYSQDHSPHAYFIAHAISLAFAYGSAEENQSYWYGEPTWDPANAVNNERLQIDSVIQQWLAATDGHRETVLSSHPILGVGLVEICGSTTPHQCAAGELGGVLYFTIDVAG
jgi:hypothetical protein